MTLLRRLCLQQLRSICFCVLLPLVPVLTLPAQVNTPVPGHEGVGVDEKAGNLIDLDLTFVNETGRVVALREYFNQGKPVLLDLAYYRCPMLCNLVLNGQADAMRKMPIEAGADYTVLTISIDPTETAELAREKRAVYLAGLDKPAPGWHFFVDHNGNAKKLAEQIGFNYRYDPKIEQYAHPSVITVLSPKGKISRYLYGIQFKPLDLRLSLAEAKEEKFSFNTEQLLLLCYHFDPQSGSYVMFAMNFMRAGGVLIVLVIVWMLIRYRRMEKAKGALANQQLVEIR
jgi:protein SCO1/2